MQKKVSIAENTVIMKLFKILIAVALLAFISSTSNAQSPAKTHFDAERWTEYIEGNMPLVISVPHGGTILADSTQLRNCEGAVTVTDTRTIELVREIKKSFENTYKLTPHIIICHLSRKNVDQNRAMEEATCGNAMMARPWQQFHDYIDTAINKAVLQFGTSMYIDLHGHGHPNQRLELGYLLNSNQLQTLDETLKNPALATKTSVNNLVASKKVDLKELLIGKTAFGTLMANSGIPAVPSMQDMAPTADEKFFSGGYNTQKYTSALYPNVFGFQIETNYKGVRDPLGRPLFAKAFAESVISFLNEHLKITLTR